MHSASNKQLMQWLWRTWRGYRLQATLNMLTGMLMVCADLAFVWCTKLAIDIATNAEKSTSLKTAILLLTAIIILQIGLGVATKWIHAALGVRARNKMQRDIFRLLMGTQWKEIRRFHTGNLINRIEQDVQTVVNFLTENLPTLATTLFKFTGAFLFLFWMEPELACIVGIIIPFFLICSKIYVKKQRKITHEIRDEESRVQSVLQESLQHTLAIKTLERPETATNRLASLHRTLHNKVIRKTTYTTISSGVLNAGFATGYLATFAWGACSLQQGLITYGAMLAFIQLVGQIQGPARTLSRFIPVFINAFTASDRLIELEQMPQEHLPESRAEQFSSSIGIKISDLSFAYPQDGKYGERNIFTHFSFDFPPGSVTAVTGETGTGKTTLIHLLLALLSPNCGRITLYDKESHTFPVSAATRICYSYVPQGNTLLSGTIRENLLMGNPDATEEELKEALKLSAADFVMLLPDGIDSTCGEMGDGLSEGQAQRIAIARALLRKSPVLLLDEATSSLDAKTEEKVLKNIMNTQKGTTIIVVTHRPEALKYCSQKINFTN